MKTCLAILACFLALAFCVRFEQVDVVEDRLPGKYFLVFASNITDDDVQHYLNKITATEKVVVENYLDALAPTFRAAIVNLTASQLQNRLLDDAFLDYVQEDSVMRIGKIEHVQDEQQTCATQSNSEWNIARISYPKFTSPAQTSIFKYTNANPTHSVSYVIDTGILLTHNEFGGRATWGGNFVDSSNTDGNGHGTHVAGTMVGTTYGICKTCRVVAVKVLGANGSGSNTGVVNGINYVAQQARSGTKCVANMSLGGAANTATDQAVQAANAAGVVMVVAAGNSNTDACSTSPARSTHCMTVGATERIAQSGSETNIDRRSSFSNYGSCVNIFAPGTSIKSAWIGSNSATSTISGTSMASPHVAGVAQAYWNTHTNIVNPNGGNQIRPALTTQATKNEIQLNCANTACNASPNLMLYNNC